MLGNLLVKLIMKLATEQVVSRIAVLTIWEASQKTDTKFDDELVKTIADGLGVNLPK
jgi:hypothetical protein